RPDPHCGSGRAVSWHTVPRNASRTWSLCREPQNHPPVGWLDSDRCVDFATRDSDHHDRMQVLQRCGPLLAALDPEETQTIARSPTNQGHLARSLKEQW